jgi:hypothetical protein
MGAQGCHSVPVPTSQPPPVELTLKTEFSRVGLIELRDRIDELLAGMPATASESRASTQDLATLKITELRQRLGKNSWPYLLACANSFNDDAWFTLDEVAAVMSRPVSAIRAYHRNVGRSEAQVDEELGPGTPPLIEARTDGRQKSYRMSAQIRRALLASGREAPPHTSS